MTECTRTDNGDINVYLSTNSDYKMNGEEKVTQLIRVMVDAASVTEYSEN